MFTKLDFPTLLRPTNTTSLIAFREDEEGEGDVEDSPPPANSPAAAIPRIAPLSPLPVLASLVAIEEEEEEEEESCTALCLVWNSNGDGSVAMEVARASALTSFTNAVPTCSNVSESGIGRHTTLLSLLLLLLADALPAAATPPPGPPGCFFLRIPEADEEGLKGFFVDVVVVVVAMRSSTVSTAGSSCALPPHRSSWLHIEVCTTAPPPPPLLVSLPTALAGAPLLLSLSAPSTTFSSSDSLAIARLAHASASARASFRSSVALASAFFCAALALDAVLPVLASSAACNSAPDSSPS
mmetsp:Transcript_36426/g.72221  ORF Transcript_36426/g.72221 Transcript_36426/m.72221 type:complete len:298 (+) Transcript_36426:736-1629(+)